MSFKLDSLLERKKEGRVGRKKERQRREEKIKIMKVKDSRGR